MLQTEPVGALRVYSLLRIRKLATVNGALEGEQSKRGSKRVAAMV